jgi:hypothetical protein
LHEGGYNALVTDNYGDDDGNDINDGKNIEVEEEVAWDLDVPLSRSFASYQLPYFPHTV